jgi:hypothetical protein
MLLGMVAVVAAPMRLFEVLGLQQTLKMHALVAVAFLASHPAAALQGARCGPAQAHIIKIIIIIIAHWLAVTESQHQSL